jgi:hypothetical protein
MEQQLPFATHGFTAAKASLSEVMSGVVRDHQPAVVERFHGKEAMALMSVDDLRMLLNPFEFRTLASVSDGEFVLNQEDLGLIAGGATFDEALAELEELALSYAHQFFERRAFYLETDRAGHYPYVFKVLATPREQLGEVLVPTPDRGHAGQ